MLDEQLDLLGAKLDPPSFDEELVRLGGRERQLVGAQFHECASGSQPRQLQRGVRACDDDQAGARGQMFEREVYRGKTLPIRHRLKVVEDQSQRVAVPGHRVQQLVDGMFD